VATVRKTSAPMKLRYRKRLRFKYSHVVCCLPGDLGAGISVVTSLFRLFFFISRRVPTLPCCRLQLLRRCETAQSVKPV
jgi:hypothetical protein